jgi:hypothetical protein
MADRNVTLGLIALIAIGWRLLLAAFCISRVSKDMAGGSLLEYPTYVARLSGAKCGPSNSKEKSKACR